MKRWFTASLVIIILLIVVFGFTTPSLPKKSAVMYKLEELDNRIVDANQVFGRKLYRQVMLVENKAHNVFISPLSISLALDMTNNGAIGETQTAISKVLGHDKMTMDEINQGNTVLLNLLKHNKSEITLSIANSLWMKKGKEFHEVFLQQSEKYYDAQLSAVDFSDAKTIANINKWVDKQTNHKITNIINEPINPKTVLFLLNAIYFNATWATPFNKSATQTGDFHLIDGTIKQAPLMSQSGYYDFVATDQYQAIRLPYKGDSMNMLVILPAEDTTLDNLQQQLFADSTANSPWPTNFQSKVGSIQLPKFNVAYETELVPILKSLGMSIATDPKHADFSGMAPPPNLYINKVKHKTFIEVNETGTTAAAVTSVEMIAGSAAPISPFQMIVNRPFFFVIEDEKTHVILFMGSIYDPTN